MIFYSAIFIKSSLSDKPSPPKHLHATEVYKDYITVEWERPESDGGSEITKYTLERKDEKRDRYIACGDTDATTLKCKITKLIEGNHYSFRVFAHNDVGSSDPCETEDPIKCRLPFGIYAKYFRVTHY